MGGDPNEIIEVPADVTVRMNALEYALQFADRHPCSPDDLIGMARLFALFLQGG